MLCLTTRPDEFDVEVRRRDTGEILGRVVVRQLHGRNRVTLGFDFAQNLRIERVPARPAADAKEATR